MKLGDAMALAMNSQDHKGNVPDLVKNSPLFVYRYPNTKGRKKRREQLQKWVDEQEVGREFTMRDVGKIFNITSGKARGVFLSLERVEIIRTHLGKPTGVWRRTE